MRTRWACAALMLPAVAWPQASLSIFGTIDASLVRGSGSVSHRTAAVSDSFMGFSGEEPLGGGVKAVFWLEGAFFTNSGLGVAPNPRNQPGPNPDEPSPSGRGFTFNRLVYVGLQSPLVFVRVGRDYTPTFAVHALYDPSTASGMLGSQSATGSLTVGGSPAGIRVSNSLGIAVGELRNGPLLHMAYAMGENRSDSGSPLRDGNYAGLRLAWTGPVVDVAVGYGVIRQASVGDTREAILGATLDLQRIKFWTIHVRDRTALANTMRGSMLAATVPWGPWQFRSTVSRSAQRNHSGAPAGTVTRVGVAAHYSFSRRTLVYARFARTGNGDGGAALPQGGVGETAANRPGFGQSIGITHNF